MTDNEKVNILMVDDQPGKLLTYEAILAELGENLIKASNAAQALEVLLRTDVAVVLMDVSMPELDGFELADLIRQHPRFQKTAIIFISGVHLSESDTITGYQRGAVDYISVPVVPEVLRAKISIFVELHRKTRMLERLNLELERRVEARTEELRQSETQFRTLANSIPQLAAMAGPDGVLQWFNQRWCEFAGMSMESLVERGWIESLHPGHAARVEREVLQNVKAGRAWDDTLQMRGRDGEYRWFLFRGVPVLGPDGTPARWFATATDISHIMELENTLRERAELLELASEAIMVVDAQGSIRYWNSGAERFYGWDREEAIGQSVHGLLQTIFPLPLHEVEAILRARGSWQGNLKQRTRDGREVTVSSRLSLHRETESILEINRDITGELRAEEALRQTEKLAAMGRMAGIIAHEINNPLEAITNAFYLLRNHPSLDSEAQYYASLAEQELQRASHITRQTLSFYRESKNPVPVHLTEVLDSVLQLQQRAMQSANVQLETRYNVRNDFIYAHPVELRQVFLNLIGNAVQAMPEGGRLGVRLSSTHAGPECTPGLVVSIIDTGSGIKPADATHLFEPFFSTKSSKGTGLGLWISHGIVQKYEGRISFRSLSHRGCNYTCFRVFLPSEKRIDMAQLQKSAAEPASVPQ